MSVAPIALFTYNRLWHVSQTIEALKKNDLSSSSDLIVFSDGSKDGALDKKVEEVRQYLKTIVGFKSVNVIKRKCNFGLAQSIISGVTEVVNEYGRVIVMEDDLVASPFFLRYMNDALELYMNEEKVISIHGYMFPVAANLPETFFLRDPGCWGWATWKRGWDLFEPDGVKLRKSLKDGNMEREFNFSGSYDYMEMLESQIAGSNDSWAVRWYASAFLLNKLTLYPGKSLVQNIGSDGSGRHGGSSNNFACEIATCPVRVGGAAIEENIYARSILIKYLMTIRDSWIRKLALNIRGVFSKAYSVVIRK